MLSISSAPKKGGGGKGEKRGENMCPLDQPAYVQFYVNIVYAMGGRKGGE